MKKLGVLLLAGLMMFSVTACGGGGEETTSTEAPAATTQATEATGNVIQLPATVIFSYPDASADYLYLSGAGVDEWGEDLLKGQSLGTGQQISLVLNVDANNLKWDIKIADEAGNEIEFRGLDLSNVSTSGCTIELTADADGTPIAVAK